MSTQTEGSTEAVANPELIDTAAVAPTERAEPEAAQDVTIKDPPPPPAQVANRPTASALLAQLPPRPAPELPNPVLDFAKPYGEIYGGAPGEARYAQSGHYFSADGKYLSTDASAPKTSEAASEERQVLVEKNVDEAEVDRFLEEDPIAQQMMELPREEVVEQVKLRNGPVVSGDGAMRYMVAWLMKYG